MSTKHLSRRDVLRAAGVALALPWLEAMRPRTARGDDKFPRRLVTFYVPDGFLMDRFTPVDDGANYTLPAMMSSLAPHRADLQILTNLGNPPAAVHGTLGSHSTGVSSLLTVHAASPTTGGALAAGISIDQILAKAWRGKTRLPSLEVGTNQKGRTSTAEKLPVSYAEHLSWAGPDQPMPKELNARGAFGRLFGGASVVVGKSVLDYVLDQANDLHGQLGAVDQKKLDQYLTSVRELEQRLDAPAPKGVNVDPATINKDVGDMAGQVRSMLDVIALALATDATRVVTYMFSEPLADAVYDFLGMNEGHHALSHHGGDAAKKAAVDQISTWEMTQLAYLLGKLKGMTEGGGSVLDNSIVYFTSDVGDGALHLHSPLPVIVAGRGGGALHPGRHLVLPNNPPLANLYASFFAALGVPQATLDGMAVTPIDGL